MLTKDRVIPLVMKILLGSTLVLASAALVLFYLVRRDPRREAARQDLAEIQRAVGKYRADTGQPPATLQEMFSKPGYLEPRRDPWGNLYRYAPPDRVWSMGPDGWDNTPDDLYP
jgi:hypothetical protein